MQKNDTRMNWTKTLKAAALTGIAAIGLMASPNATAQSTNSSSNSSSTTAGSGNVLTISLSTDELLKLVQGAADILTKSGEQSKADLSAAADSVVKTGAAALQEIMSISASTAADLLTELNRVADSVATVNKAATGAAKTLAEAKAAQASKMIKQGTQTLAGMATDMTRAQADSLKQTLSQTRDAIDAALKKLEEEQKTK